MASELEKTLRFGSKSIYNPNKNNISADEYIEEKMKLALEKFDPAEIPPTYMYVSVSGVIQSGTVSSP